MRPPTIVGDIAILHGPNGEQWLVDAVDLPLVGHINWTRDFPNTYAITNYRTGAKRLRLHVAIANPPAGFVVDHIDGNAYDNRRNNLRICREDQNGCNLPLSKANTSGHKGVGWYKANSCWRAYIVRNGRQIHLGYFDRKEDAIAAHARAEPQIFGEFTRDASALHNKRG